MRDFNRRDSSGPRRSFDSRGGFGRGNEDRQTFKAVCADCGRDCDLPFEPRGNRPVYCRDCFKNHPQEDRPQRFEDRGRGGDRRDSRGGSGDRLMFSAVCDNCGKTCQLPFEPRAGKPVFCSRCFEDKEKGVDMSQRRSASNGTQKSSDLDAINVKLDKILNLLSNGKAVKKAENFEKNQPKTSFTAAVTAENIEQSLKKVKTEKVVKVSKPKKTKKIAPVEVFEAGTEVKEAPIEVPTETPTE